MSNSLSKLFKEMGSELGEKISKPSAKKKYSLFEQMGYEISNNRIEEVDVGAAVKKGVAAVGATAKKVFDFLKTKIKKISKIGFRLGYAVAQTVKNAFVLVTRSGRVVTPELDKIAYEQYKGKPTLTLWLDRVKGKEHKVRMSERLDFGFGKLQLRRDIGVISVLEPKSSPLREGIDYPKGQMLNEITEKEAQKQLDIATANTMESFSDTGMNALQQPIPKAKPVVVDYDDFKDELNELMDTVQYGTAVKAAKIAVLGIYAPTGWGKSQMIEEISKARGFHYFPLELQKVPLEIVQGFPYLDDAEVENADEDVKSERAKIANKIVKMAPSSILPKSEAPGNWILFFDEFNRADTEKMSAVMNLLLTGELGGASSMTRDPKTGKMVLKRYSLPKKTAVILAMNTGEQKGVFDTVNAVNDMDIATLERVHRVLFGRYHAGAWFKSFALNVYNSQTKAGDKFVLPWRIPPIITQYITAVTKGQVEKEMEGGEWEKSFLIPIRVAKGEEGKGGGGERTTSPRAWTMIADRMIKNGMVLWKKMSDDEKDKFTEAAEKIKEEIKKRSPEAPDDLDIYKFAAFFKDAGTQMLLLSKESPELGEEGEDLINKMIRHFWKTGKEGVGPEQILFNYKALRPQVVENYKSLGFGSHSQLMSKLFNVLQGFKSEKEIDQYMKEHSFQVISKKGAIEQVYLTIKQLFQDLDMSMGDFKTFAVNIKKNKAKNEVLNNLHLKLANWDVYLEAARGKTKAEMEKEGGEEEE
jgi:hypothetical protein